MKANFYTRVDYTKKLTVILFQLIVINIIILQAPSLVVADDTQPPLNIQVIVSMMKLDEDNSNFEDTEYDITFLGAAAQQAFSKNIFEYGFETGANVSMENDTNVLKYSIGSSGGTVKVAIDNKWFLMDYFAGGYAAVNVSKRLRIYTGAGPLLIYGSWKHEPDDDQNDFEDDRDSKLSAGGYARAGIEYAIVDLLSIGAGVRTIATGLEFNDSVGDVQIEGPQFFFNVSFKI